jgi:nucleosome assembly protein 1-like 1
LPQAVQNRVKALKKLQADHDSLEDEYDKELAALEKKYEALKKPLYERRSAIVVGDSEPNAAELAWEDKRKKEEQEKGEGEQPKKEGEPKKEETKKEGEPAKKKEEGKAGDNNNNKDENVKGIPEFWLQALRHHPDFAELITEKDLDALKHLKDVRVKPLEDEVSFAIEFQFDPNPYFDETLLTKTYHLRERGGEIMYQSVDGTEIHWKQGKNLTVTIVTKTTGGGRGGRRGGRRGGGNQQQRTIKVEQPCESFFNFFNPEAFTALGADEDELEDEELEALLEADYEMGAAIKEQIIPNAVEWFTGEAELEFDEYEDDDEDGEDDEEDDEDDDGGEGEEDYNSEEDEDFTPPPPGQEQQPECKQQ